MDRMDRKDLHIGDTSENGQITIIDEDRLCYLVKSTSRGAYGIRTISKSLLSEYVSYFANNPDASANDARDALSGNSDIDKFEYGYTSTLKVMAQMVLGKIEITTTKDVSIIKIKTGHPLQQIFYGAPGTGKSHTINEITELQPKENVFRTTFHPDSDYSTFVGCYKPTKSKSGQNVKQAILDYDSLVDKFKEYLNVPNANITKVCTQFGFDYHDSIVRIQEQGRKVMDLVNDAYKSNTSYDSVVRGGMACYEQVLSTVSGSSITYEFVPQSFTKAYLRAWQATEPVYLVIEEINRGNCAQIFGDLFQLLDRKCDGFSEYPIKADNDLATYIAENLSASIRTDIPDSVRSGEELSLPSNLYIWATMNTSDQSLFPIDSAFKRRWEWKYIKITKGKDKDGKDLDWKLKFDYKDKDGKDINKEYGWWDFIQKINTIIASMTSSADKQLGYFFCKAGNDGIISEETFVSKVLFYLWNDVFKDYGFEDASLFQYEEVTDGKTEKKDLAFPNFYNEDGDKVDTERVADFVQKVMSWSKDKEDKK